MELDTAVRHKLPMLVVISLNGGWTADPKKEKIGRDLGYTRFDKMAEALGCYGEYVEKPEDIGPALRARAEEGRPGHGRARQRQDRRHGARRHGVLLVACGGCDLSQGNEGLGPLPEWSLPEPPHPC